MYSKDTVRQELFAALGTDCKVHLLVSDAYYEWDVVVVTVTETTVWLYKNPTATRQGERVEVPLSWVLMVE